MRRRNLPLAAVTWGGNQTAKGGGLDVRVALPHGTNIDGFVPNADAGYQVKKQDMSAAAIIKDIRPKGVVRPAILELSNASGAYIIVSSTGSTSYSALNSRARVHVSTPEMSSCPYMPTSVGERGAVIA